MIVVISNRMIRLEPLKIDKTVTTIFQIVTVSIGINLKCWDESLTQLSYLVSSYPAAVVEIFNSITGRPRIF
jgi:hypothetical protein